MKYKLGELVQIKYGKDHKKLEDGNIPVYGTGGLMRKVNDFLYSGESVLIPRKGSLNHVMFVTDKFWTVDTMFWTKIDNKKVLPKYLYYCLSKLDLSALNVGSAVPSLTVKILNEINLEIPSLDSQRKVIKKIEPIERKIVLNNQINDNLLELLNAQYKHLLSKHNLAKVKLSELCDISAGGDKPKKISKMKSNENLVPVYSNGTNKDGLYGYTNKAKIFKKAVTISARGTIGYTVLRTEPFVPIVRLISLQSKGAISAEFLYLLISNLSIQGYGSTQQQITVPYMKKIVVNIPSLNLINKFQKEISPLFNQIDRNKRENEQLTNIRNVLLDKFVQYPLGLTL